MRDFMQRVLELHYRDGFEAREEPLPGDCCSRYKPERLYAEGWQYGVDMPSRLILRSWRGERYVLWAVQNFLGQVDKYFVKDDQERYKINRPFSEYEPLRWVMLDPSVATDRVEANGWHNALPWDFRSPFFLWGNQTLSINIEGKFDPNSSSYYPRYLR